METFQGHSFEKQAAPINMLRKLYPGNAAKGVKDIVDKTKQPGGTFVSKPADSTINPEKLRLFDENEVTEKANQIIKDESSGSFIVDGLLGLTKRVVPKTKDFISNAKVKGKQKIEEWDTAAGKVLAGNDPDSFRGKIFSTKIAPQTGEYTNPDGRVSRILKEDRRASLLAPVSNTTKAVSPILAAMYVGDKMYPADDLGNVSNQPTYEQAIQKLSSTKSEKNIFDKSLFYEMDKVASIQKIAELEESISKYATELETAHMEKVAIEKQLEQTIKEKEGLEKQASEMKREVLEKQAAFEELRLRTLAQKRSKVAVDLSEQMLEQGLIKQAEFDNTIDKLMECDESTLKLYQTMVKEAKQGEETVESLAILREYKGNDKLAMSSKELGSQGLSKRGQSIGEAARDLNSKR